MRINDPKSFAGFAFPSNLQDSTYKLATIGQVKNAIQNLDNKFTMLLGGAPGPSEGTFLDDEGVEHPTGLVTGKQAGQGGLTNKQGYAWLDHNGKIDASLLPSLAITETYVIEQKDLYDPNTDTPADENVEQNSIYTLLENWVNNKIISGGMTFQKGDILIVTPSKINDHRTTISTPVDEGVGEHETEVHPAYSGTYIITDMKPANNKFNIKFAKMAYTDSAIVSVNDESPSNSAGKLTLYLKDILKTKTYRGIDGTDNVELAKELEDVVYRLVKIDEGADGYRFAFIDNSTATAGNYAEDHIVKYAKLKELNAETSARMDADNDIINLVNTYKGILDETDNNLSTEIMNINGKLGVAYYPTPDLIDNNGYRDPVSSTIYEQLASLRNDVDWNAGVLNATRNDTNDLLLKIQNNVDSLYDHLDGKAVAILEKKFTWVAGVPVISNSDATSEIYEMIPVPDVGTVIGKMIWHYDYVSSTSGKSNLSPLPSDNFATNYENSENNPSSALRNTSKERILAVFDPDGNKVEVDIESKFVDNTYHQILTAYTDYFGPGNEHNNMLNNGEWTLLISKTIVGIANVKSSPIAVGTVNGDILKEKSYDPNYRRPH